MNVKSIFKKENIMPVAVLVVICLVVAALLGGVDMLTKNKIAEVEQQKVYASLKEVLDGHITPVDKLPEGAADTITAIYEVRANEGDTDLLGKIATVKVKGYAGDILMTVGVKADGTVSKVVITSQSESHGKAGMATYPDRFSGVGAEEVGSVDHFTGATVSSTAIRGGVIDAVNAITGGSVSAPDSGSGEDSTFESPRSDDELLTLALALVGEGADLEAVSMYNAPKGLYKLYSDKGGKGYVAYVLTVRQYNGSSFADNEALVHIDTEGNIKAVNHLTWVVGHDVQKGDYAQSFVGKDYWSVDGVELLTGATGTSQSLKTVIVDALEYVTKLIPRSDSKLLTLVDAIVPNSEKFEEVEFAADAPSTLKKIYRETSGKGYVAYVTVEGWGGSVACESLVYLNGEGTILDVEILIWNVGHGIGPGNFADQFTGKTADTLSEVELIAGCTGTTGGLRDSIAAALPYVPTDIPAARIVGIVLISAAALSVIGLALYKFIKRRKCA